VADRRSISDVTARRKVELRTLADLTEEVERVYATAAAGRVRPLGNWSAAQVFQHLALFIAGSLDGFSFQYPWPWRWAAWLVGRYSWPLLLRLAFRPGFRNPPAAAAVEPDPSVSLEDAAAQLRRQLQRLEGGERMTRRSPTGEMLTHEQWLDCHLRHAELHLSFLDMDPP
jgi:hypothetical protein